MITLLAAASLSVSLERLILAKPIPVGRFTSGIVTDKRQTVGFLISNCHAMTTRVLFTRGQDPVGQSVRFTSSAGATTGTVVAVGEWPNFKGVDFSGDWLIARLDRCVGKQIGFLRLASALESTQVVTATFVDSRMPPRLERCTMLSYSQKATTSDCNYFELEGGAPMIAYDSISRELRVVGLLSGFYPKKNTSVAMPIYWMKPSYRKTIDDLISGDKGRG